MSDLATSVNERNVDRSANGKYPLYINLGETKKRESETERRKAVVKRGRYTSNLCKNIWKGEIGREIRDLQEAGVGIPSSYPFRP